eukprot:GFYU01010615.1.p1 GENE.GFYU01010615.1~~GFYU01010615.1.p1  ORF type:complete len:490 (-),score=126.43 GFYU01010615.1:58-1506(-)
MAIDVYGKGVRPTDNAAKGAEASKYIGDPALAKQRVIAGYNRLMQVSGINYVYVAGYCFGGSMALQMTGVAVNATTIFHPNSLGLGSGIPTGSIQVQNGADDPLVTNEAEHTFKTALKAADVDWEWIDYGNSVHGFTHTGPAYNQIADLRAHASEQRLWKESSMLPPMTGAVTFAANEIATSDVLYTDAVDGTSLTGYSAEPDPAMTFTGDKLKQQTANKGKVVVLIHQWGGLTDFEKQRAELYASMGYHAFAVDVYGTGIRPVSVADKASNSTLYGSNHTLAVQRLAAGYNAVKGRFGNPSAVVVLGYCFGGGVGMAWARENSNLDVRGFVLLHPNSLAKQSGSGTVHKNSTVMVLNGDLDTGITNQTKIDFQNEMAVDGVVDWQWVDYAKAQHGFSHQGARYNANADMRATDEINRLLTEIMPDPATSSTPSTGSGSTPSTGTPANTGSLNTSEVLNSGSTNGVASITLVIAAVVAIILA